MQCTWAQALCCLTNGTTAQAPDLDLNSLGCKSVSLRLSAESACSCIQDRLEINFRDSLFEGANLPVGVKKAARLVGDSCAAAATLDSVEERPLQSTHKLQQHPQHARSIRAACNVQDCETFRCKQSKQKVQASSQESCAIDVDQG